jgi:sigma-54 dependent transcriptional regulator, acetoin dehydrogenase operon transcriptional activator AcoR
MARASQNSLAATSTPQFALIEQSHQRCEALGLSRIERPDYAPLARNDVALAVERSQRLYAHAAPAMELLLEQIAGTESMIVLTDAQGTILHSLGDDDFLSRAGKVALTPGVSWAEHSKGTNAIGTSLFEEAPTLVHAGQHFMHANDFLTCSAAPIFDPRGGMLGVLDVSGDHRTYHQHTMGLVRMSARMIENHWLSDDCSSRLRLHFHSRPEFIGSLLEGIIVVGPEGRITGSNRSALDQLGLSAAALRMHSLTSLLGTSVAAVMDHFRSPMAPPLQANLSNGQVLHLSARFSWAPRPSFGARDSKANAAGGASASPPRTTLPQESVGTQAPARSSKQKLTPAVNMGLEALAGGDAQVRIAIQKVRHVLDRDIPLLIQGETGTGKNLLAHAIHQDSRRRGQPIVVVNCASLHETLIEAELFGREDDERPGARRGGAPGSLACAHGGTLVLDEIGDLPAPLQARLLGVLEERQVRPLDGGDGIPVNLTIISTTRRNLRELIGQQKFREDLYYRLNGLSVRLPALRDRSDLAAVAQRILLRESPLRTPRIGPEVMGLFQRCQWPGNIRQLANVLRMAATLAGPHGLITPDHLEEDFFDELRSTETDSPPALDEPTEAKASALPRTMKDAELQAIREAVAAANGNISMASRQLGICRNTIYRKLHWKGER